MRRVNWMRSKLSGAWGLFPELPSPCELEWRGREVWGGWLENRLSPQARAWESK